MKQSDEEMVMRSYLLGNLEEGLLDEFEGRLIRDEAFAERFSIAEDNLIDDYVFNGLSESERESFNANFLINDERRDKILLARTFDVYVAEEPQRQPAVREPLTLSQLWHSSIVFLQRHKLWVAFSVATIVLLAVLVPLIFNFFGPQSAISPLNVHRADLERQIAELNKYNTNNVPGVSVIVQPFLFREGDEIQKVTVTRDTKIINIKLQLPSGSRYETYRATMETLEGVELFDISDLKTDSGTSGGLIPFKISANVLPQGDYQIRLRGGTSQNVATDVARYNLRIIHAR